ncbi:MAG: hypothetical protein JXA13_17275 [Anaerolineales bacterium]|nr:hypothetical protein [Anaerolineales bacterium]
MKTRAEILITAPQTVFSVDDLATLWQIADRSRLWETIKYYIRSGRLFSIQRGVYARSKDYSPLEAAVKIFPPAYISFTTALAIHGAYFQYTSEIHVMAQASKKLEIPNGTIVIYHQLKNQILLNQQGIEKVDGYWIASLERAICDTYYLDPSFTFEHLQNANIEKIRQLSKIYRNSALEKRLENILNTNDDDESMKYA